MIKNRKQKTPTPFYKIYPLLLFVCTCFMCVGYAVVNSITLDIKGSAIAKSQEEVFITDVNYVSNVNANLENSKIINAYQTMLNSNITLSDTDPYSSITYSITMYNSTDYDYYFEKVDYLSDDTTYSNEDIVFEISGISSGDILNAKEYVTINLTFHYKDNILSNNNTLISYLNFKFDFFSFKVDSWRKIAEAIKNGYSSRYNLGDTKEIDLGNYGKHTVRIANISTPDECSQENFSQTACGFVIEFVDILEKTYNMNSSSTNVGGWEASEMRSFINNDIFSSLPSDLQDKIIDTKVISGHGNQDTNNFVTIDNLYLLDAKEIYGIEYNSTENASSDNAKNNERQLDYYLAQGTTPSANTNAIKQRYEKNFWWWFRTANGGSSTGFFGVGSNGVHYNFNSNNTGGISPAFRIG